MPTVRFISPEAAGKFPKGSAEFGINAQPRVSLVSDADAQASPPVTVRPDFVESQTQFEFFGSLGIMRRLDLFVSLRESPSEFGVKYQLLGQPETTAEAGNFSLSL